MDSNKIKYIIIATIALLFSIYLGITAATAQTEAMLWVGGFVGIVILFSLGRHIWVLIPMFAVLEGTLTAIPGNPSPWYAITPVAATMLALRFLMRAKNFTYQSTWMDACMLLQIVVLFQAYVRNPTGLALFGSTEMIGGRPYVNYAVAISAYFILATVKTELKIIKSAILCMVVLSLLDTGIMCASSFSGTLSRAVGAFYSNVDYAANEAGAQFQYILGETRMSATAGLGVSICQILFSFNRPIDCLRPLPIHRPIMLVFSIVMILLSGFRNALFRVVCLFVVSTLARGKKIDFLLTFTLGIVFLCFGLAFGAKNLPHTAQRALSFLPIEVDDTARADAEQSSEWRYRMWRIALTSDKYIKNKWLGDGFGYSVAEYEAQMQASLGIKAYAGDDIEAFLQKGSYHGWHVEAIRFAGVLGLVVGIIILFSFAGVAWKLIIHYRGCDFYPYALFLCVPFVFEPAFTLLVFGSYKGSFIKYIAMSAMLRLVYGHYLEERRTRKISQPNVD